MAASKSIRFLMDASRKLTTRECSSKTSSVFEERLLMS